MATRIARIVLVVAMLAVGACGSGGSEALTDHWLAFDPCELGDRTQIAALLGSEDLTTEVVEQHPIMGDSEVVKGKTCRLEVPYGPGVSIGFTQGTSSLDRGGRSVDLPGIGDEAAMSVYDDPEHEGEIIGIFANVEGMWLSVAPPTSDTPVEGSPKAEQLISIARVAADRLRVAAQSE